MKSARNCLRVSTRSSRQKHEQHLIDRFGEGACSESIAKSKLKVKKNWTKEDWAAAGMAFAEIRLTRRALWPGPARGIARCMSSAAITSGCGNSDACC